MIYKLLLPWVGTIHGLGVVRYLTFRAAWAMLTAMTLSVIIYPRFIRWMQAHHHEQVIREDGPESHLLNKAHTPTMGGVVLISSTVLSSLLWTRLDAVGVWLVLIIMLGYGAIGFYDDYRKVKEHDSRGLSARAKLLSQFLIGLLAISVGLYAGALQPTITLPFYKEGVLAFDALASGLPDFTVVYVAFALFMLVGSSNAVNLTDGLDGLAIGPVMTSAATFGLIAYLAGNARFSGYLAIPYVEGAGELMVLLVALVGAGLGFLWYNTYPASVFMGDVGSLSLGGTLAMIALLVRQELLLALVGVVFVAEAVSVIIQVVSFKTRKKRVFLMTPIHHHFEKSGWPEPTIVIRFWIISIAGALLALSTLKLR